MDSGSYSQGCIIPDQKKEDLTTKEKVKNGAAEWKLEEYASKP